MMSSSYMLGNLRSNPVRQNLALSAQYRLGDAEAVATYGQAADDCTARLKLAESDASPRLTMKELDRRAIRRAMPTLPGGCGGCRLDGIVELTLLVNRDGEVECIALKNGHPLLVPVTIEAERQWRFRRLKRHREAVPFVGHFAVRYSTSRTPAVSLVK